MVNVVRSGVKKVYSWLAADWFFYSVLLLFCIHTIWLALSSILLPYDEYYHVGIIQYYAQQWTPFIQSQSLDVSYLGDITRLPSYVYHYLMSFPYRFLSIFTQNEQTLTIALRFINIGMFLGGTLLFRKLFLRAGISKRIINVAIAFFLLTPFTVMIAAENNYDNLIFLLTPLLFWFAYNLVSKSKVHIIDALSFMIVGLFGCLVKNTYIIIIAASMMYVGAVVLSRYSTVWSDIKDSIKKSSGILIALLVTVFLVLSGLFVERHFINVVKYGGYDLDCDKVQTLEICEQFSPFKRNIQAERAYTEPILYGNPLSFFQHWVATNMAGLYPIFANVPYNANPENLYGNYDLRPRLAILLATAYAVLIVGLIALALNFKTVISNPLLQFFIFSAAILAGTLLIFNYNTYLSVGKPYAIQVRYLLPVMLPIILIILYALSSQFKKYEAKKYITAVVLVAYLLWGGVVGWIIRADASWYWPNQTVVSANQKVQAILQKMVPN